MNNSHIPWLLGVVLLIAMLVVQQDRLRRNNRMYDGLMEEWEKLSAEVVRLETADATLRLDNDELSRLVAADDKILFLQTKIIMAYNLAVSMTSGLNDTWQKAYSQGLKFSGENIDAISATNESLAELLDQIGVHQTELTDMKANRSSLAEKHLPK